MCDAERIAVERGLRAAVLAGDESAWRAWYDRHADDLERYVRWRCGGLAEFADDAVQDAWMTAVRRVADFVPERGAFRDWLFGIAGGVVRNQVRSRTRRVRRVAVLADEPSVVDRGDDDREAVARALSELPERCERALRAKYLDGLSVAEIAAAWGETPKAVESLLARAREAFRRVYEGCDRAG